MNIAVIFQCFGTSLFRLGTQNHFKIYCILCRLWEVEALLDLHRSFEHSLVNQSRVYVAIGVTDVMDYASNNITRNLSLPLRTYPTRNKCRQIVFF